MTPNPGSIFKSGFTILSVLALLAGESGASSIRWCGVTPHRPTEFNTAIRCTTNMPITTIRWRNPNITTVP